MLEVPGTPWREERWDEEEAMQHAPPQGGGWARMPGEARHGFTHFELAMDLFAARGGRIEPAEGEELRAVEEAERALPTVMRKLLKLAC
jgi:A/G-specific adenine glycosylase